jgi:hypothetical protein
MIRGRRRGLDDEHVLAANIFLDLHKRFAVGKWNDIAFAQFAADGFANGPGQGFIGGAAKYFHESIVFLVKTEKPPLSADEIAARTLTTNEPDARAFCNHRAPVAASSLRFNSFR